VDRIRNSNLEEVVFANSIPLKEETMASGRIKQLSVAPLLAQAIQSIHEETSVSGLFV
jgi:ribose-phosphate pyrophosphokinase